VRRVPSAASSRTSQVGHCGCVCIWKFDRPSHHAVDCHPQRIRSPTTAILILSFQAFGPTSALGSINPLLFLSVYLLLYPVLQWGGGGYLFGVSRTRPPPLLAQPSSSSVVDDDYHAHDDVDPSPRSRFPSCPSLPAPLSAFLARPVVQAVFNPASLAVYLGLLCCLTGARGAFVDIVDRSVPIRLML
jgi:hypothetical protein